MPKKNKSGGSKDASPRQLVILLVLVVILIAGGAYYWFKVRPASTATSDSSGILTSTTGFPTTSTTGMTPTDDGATGADGDTSTPADGAGAPGTSTTPAAGTGSNSTSTGGGSSLGKIIGGSGATSRSLTSDTASSNTPYGLQVATQIAHVFATDGLTVSVELDLSPAVGGVGVKKKTALAYRKSVQSAIMQIKLSDLSEWTANSKATRSKLVSVEVGTLRRKFPHASASVTVVDPTGMLVAVGDGSAGSSRSSVKVYG